MSDEFSLVICCMFSAVIGLIMCINMGFPAVPREIQIDDEAMSDDSIDFEGIESVDWCGVITAQTSDLGFNDVNNSCMSSLSGRNIVQNRYFSAKWKKH